MYGRVGRGQGGARDELRELVNPIAFFVYDKDFFVRQYPDQWFKLCIELEMQGILDVPHVLCMVSAIETPL